MPTLVMLSPAPVIELPEGEVLLDARFVEGMHLHAQLWPGPVYCLLRRGAEAIPEGLRFAQDRLGFELIVIDAEGAPPETLLDEAGLIYCAADDMRYLAIAAALRGRLAKLVYTLEAPLSARIRAALLAPRGLRKRLGSAFWNLRHERVLRRALRAADGLHLNGLHTAAAYSRANDNILAYQDNRQRQTGLARSNDQRERAERIRTGGPLRLIAPALPTGNGRLADLLPIAFTLRAGGLDFRLRIEAPGAEAARLEAGISALALEDRVQFGPAESRAEGDLALLPLTGGEAALAGLEALGRGLPVLGYAAPGLPELLRASSGGWISPARPGAMARRILRLAADPELLVQTSGAGLAYAADQTFEKVFARRMAHLRALIGHESGQD